MFFRVSKSGNADFTNIQDAINALPADGGMIFISSGTYKERVEILKPNVTLIGENATDTIITEGYYALEMMPDGFKRGTFRSYTFLVNANHFKAFNLTFENSSGFGTKVGQAVAVYAEGDDILFKNCIMLGHQDTLFTGPLPLSEKEKGGFTGPTENAPRRKVHQCYEDCYIEGEVDFIFGSAAAYFLNCTLFALDRGEEVNAYYTAPSTYEGQEFGYVFESCKFTGNCPPRSVYLSRPWRIHAKCVLLRCELDDELIPEGFFDWNKPESHETVQYAEYKCTGSGANRSHRASFSRELTDSEAAAITRERVLSF